ncbi:MAG: hypothetical protein U0K87_03530 [Ruminococcus sp.]|nr:hypothetical protein [Ruminococcus sp.]MEE1171404.1 hypothetical protein [Ruminococcus sp.]
MNLNGFEFDKRTADALSALASGKRLPHAVVLESHDDKAADEAARALSMFAVCQSENKPCGECPQCQKAFNRAHADITYLKTTNKSKTYAIEQIREVISDVYIRPNEADCKIYIFEHADECMTTVAQNAFLKVLEEPPQDVSFILLCQNSRRLLPTILSRCTLLRLGAEAPPEGDVLDRAEEIVNGILSPREYDLLLALRAIFDKERSGEILGAVAVLLRDGLAVLSGAKAVQNHALGTKIAATLPRGVLLELISLTRDAQTKTKTNININLFATWLCGEYRRISWQR